MHVNPSQVSQAHSRSPGLTSRPIQHRQSRLSRRFIFEVPVSQAFECSLPVFGGHEISIFSVGLFLRWGSRTTIGHWNIGAPHEQQLEDTVVLHSLDVVFSICRDSTLISSGNCLPVELPETPVDVRGSCAGHGEPSK